MAKKKTTKAKKSPKKVKRKRQPSVVGIDHFPEGDARILADANAIKVDKPRFKRAQIASKKLIKEQQAQIEGLRKALRGEV